MASLLLATLGVSVVQAQIVGIDSEPSNAADVSQIETVTITGTRISANENPVNALTTVITREMIESRADENVIDLLRGQSGVHVAQAGGRGGIASVQLRGGDPNFTLVLIDGVKVNDPTNARGGSFDFSSLPLAQIERIEIIRGAQSSVYGSDGLGGVVSISTREPSTAGECGRCTRRIRFSAYFGEPVLFIDRHQSIQRHHRIRGRRRHAGWKRV